MNIKYIFIAFALFTNINFQSSQKKSRINNDQITMIHENSIQIGNIQYWAEELKVNN